MPTATKADGDLPEALVADALQREARRGGGARERYQAWYGPVEADLVRFMERWAASTGWAP